MVMDSHQPTTPASGSWFERRRKSKWISDINKNGLAGVHPAHTVLVAKQADFRWNNKLTIAVSVFAGVFLVAAMFGYLFLPGGIFLVYCYQQAKPTRIIAVNADTISVISIGVFRNLPNERVACAGIPDVYLGGPDAVQIGRERLTMKPAEFAQLLGSLPARQPAGVAVSA